MQTTVDDCGCHWTYCRWWLTMVWPSMKREEVLLLWILGMGVQGLHHHVHWQPWSGKYGWCLPPWQRHRDLVFWRGWRPWATEYKMAPKGTSSNSPPCLQFPLLALLVFLCHCLHLHKTCSTSPSILHQCHLIFMDMQVVSTIMLGGVWANLSFIMAPHIHTLQPLSCMHMGIWPVPCHSLPLPLATAWCSTAHC